MRITIGAKLGYVDALRGIAILAVVAIHCSQVGSNNYPKFMLPVLEHCAMGVQLFYVASAFTIFLTFGQKKLNESHHALNFFIRRFFRIAPMYYLGIIYFLYQDGLGARYWLGDASEISSWNILSNVFFFHGFSPYWITSVVPGGWSIAVEVLFYCCVPFLFLKIRSLNQAIIFFLITLLLRIVLRLLLETFPLMYYERLWEEYLFFYLPSQLPVFACGIILYFLVQTPFADWRVEPTMILVLVILVLAQLVSGTTFFFPIHVQFGIAFLILGYVLSQHEFYVFVNPLTIGIGRISYSMYLVHFAILHWLDKFNIVNFVSAIPVLDYLIRFLLVTALTASVSFVTYKLMEVPFQNIGKRIIGRQKSNDQSLTLGFNVRPN
jgi:peptidoglycan/LPS O-acetylase OafA/YrhL